MRLTKRITQASITYSDIFTHPLGGVNTPPPKWVTTPPQLSVIFSTFQCFLM